jgi:hypothetical protein
MVEMLLPFLWKYRFVKRSIADRHESFNLRIKAELLLNCGSKLTEMIVDFIIKAALSTGI